MEPHLSLVYSLQALSECIHTLTHTLTHTHTHTHTHTSLTLGFSMRPYFTHWGALSEHPNHGVGSDGERVRPSPLPEMFRDGASVNQDTYKGNST